MSQLGIDTIEWPKAFQQICAKYDVNAIDLEHFQLLLDDRPALRIDILQMHKGCQASSPASQVARSPTASQRACTAFWQGTMLVAVPGLEGHKVTCGPLKVQPWPRTGLDEYVSQSEAPDCTCQRSHL